MDKHVTGIVAYLTWIGLPIAFIVGDREGAKFHLNQALVIWIAGTICGFIPLVGWIGSLFCLICAVMGIFGAINGMEKEVPLLGRIKLLQ